MTSYAYFMHITACLYVYIFPDIISPNLTVIIYLSACLCAFTWKKVTQGGEPETFFTLFDLRFIMQL